MGRVIYLGAMMSDSRSRQIEPSIPPIRRVSPGIAPSSCRRAVFRVSRMANIHGHHDSFARSRKVGHATRRGTKLQRLNFIPSRFDASSLSISVAREPASSRVTIRTAERLRTSRFRRSLCATRSALAYFTTSTWPTGIHAHPRGGEGGGREGGREDNRERRGR
jgi:hypothetical protein